MSPTDNIGKTTMTAGKFTFSTSVKPIFVTICAGTSEAASNRGMGVTNFRLVNDSYVPDTVISFAQDGFVPTALTYNASTGQMTCSTNSTKNGIYAVQCYA